MQKNICKKATQNKKNMVKYLRNMKKSENVHFI